MSTIARCYGIILEMLKKHTSILAIALLVACAQDDRTPPQVSITSPASGAPVSGTVSVQLTATDDTGVGKVSLYARAPGSTGKGVLVGSATSAPFVISLYSPKFPNGGPLELIPAAQDGAGNVTTGDPVQVQVQNPGSPVLAYLAGFNLPVDTRLRAAGIQQERQDGPLLPSLRTEQIRPPTGSRLPAPAVLSPLPLAASDRTQAIEWGWSTIPGADGYGIYLSTTDASGPYLNQRYQAAGTGGAQKFSRKLTADEIGRPLFGVITTRTQNNSVESGLSNADGTTFMTAVQQAASPADGQTVADGRPILSWNKNDQALGYLFYVLDKSPFDPTAKIVWTNAPQSTDQLSASYPSSLAALPKGTYHWWVGGVAFDSKNQADAFSFSSPRSFVVP